ncbi:MAG TPA: hypothetical protein VG757_01920 [Devosia sp.]|nr:hypothetical protein [Devosia sp.]
MRLDEGIPTRTGSDTVEIVAHQVRESSQRLAWLMDGLWSGLYSTDQQSAWGREYEAWVSMVEVLDALLSIEGYFPPGSAKARSSPVDHLCEWHDFLAKVSPLVEPHTLRGIEASLFLQWQNRQ